MAGAGQQFRRFAVDHVEIIGLGQVEVAALQSLTQFAFADPVRRLTDQPAGAGVVQRAGQVEGVREQVVAEQHGVVNAPAGVDRADVPAHGGAVEDVVVDQRGRVDHLHHGAEDVMGRRDSAAGAGGQQQQDRPQPLAAVVPDVIDDRLDLDITALERLRQDALDFFQVRRDRAVQVQGRRNRRRSRQHGLGHDPSLSGRPGAPSARGF